MQSAYDRTIDTEPWFGIEQGLLSVAEKCEIVS